MEQYIGDKLRNILHLTSIYIHDCLHTNNKFDDKMFFSRKIAISCGLLYKYAMTDSKHIKRLIIP